MMKINFVVHSLDKSNIGGVVKVVTDLANIFVENGLDVTIYSIGEINNLCFDISHKVKIVSLEFKKHSTNQYESFKKINWFIDSFNIFSKILKEKNNEIWMPTSPPLNLLFAGLKIKNSKTKIIGCDHTSTVYSKGYFVDKFKYILLKKIDYMIALTVQDQKKYQDKGLSSIYIPNFIDLSTIKSEENRKKYIIFVGRFSEEKQPLEALKIYNLSKLWEKDIKFRIFGYGNLHADILNFISTNSLESYVEVITDEIDPENIYKDAYALLMTSKVEGFGMVLLESISRNIPCIAYNVPYGPENIIVNGVNGYLLSFGDLHGGAELLKNHSLIKMHDCNIKSTLTSFSKEIIVQKWLKVLNDV
ncbi:glycosyltransferase [Acinetobacter johnsonii]|uniref:glycosyltransferase n=1 Tax=Acinetobacter johnsonii TaxID=40214 RepID=UPI003AF88AC2